MFYQYFCDIDLDKYDSDNKFIKERCFEVILTGIYKFKSQVNDMSY